MPTVHIQEEDIEYDVTYEPKGLTVIQFVEGEIDQSLKLPLAGTKPTYAMISDTKGVFSSERIQLTYSYQDEDFGSNVIRLDVRMGSETRFLGVMTHVSEKVLMALYKLGEYLTDVVEQDPEAVIWETQTAEGTDPEEIQNVINLNNPQPQGGRRQVSRGQATRGQATRGQATRKRTRRATARKATRRARNS